MQKFIKKLSLFVSLLLIVTMGAVYATWVYSESTDVADITGAKAITMTEATFSGTYGTYTVDVSSLSLVVDPKEGTSHTTALYITGDLVITFTPNTYAPVEVKDSGVESTCQFSLSNNEWKYNGEYIMTIDSQVKDIVWEKGDDGVFTYTITAAELSNIITLKEFVLDTKADYDAYDAVLTNGQIVVAVSDGQTTTPQN